YFTPTFGPLITRSELIEPPRVMVFPCLCRSLRRFASTKTLGMPDTAFPTIFRYPSERGIVMRLARHFTHFALLAVVGLGISGCERRGGAPGGAGASGTETTGTASSSGSGEEIVIGVAAPFTG